MYKYFKRKNCKKFLENIYEFKNQFNFNFFIYFIILSWAKMLSRIK